MFKYKVGEVVVHKSSDEVAVIEDIDFDHHTRKKDYYIRILAGSFHPVGSKVWMDSKTIEAGCRLATPQELVLYGDKSVSG